MADAIQVGQAVLYGIGDAAAITGFIALIETAKATHKFNLDTVEAQNGEHGSLIATNEMVEGDFVFTPDADPPSDGSGNFILRPLARVATSSFASAHLNASNWIYVGDASLDLSHKQAKVTLKLRRYIDNAFLS